MIGGVALEWWQLLVGTVLPLLTALVTLRVASSGFKAVITITLAALTELTRQVVETATATGSTDWGQFLPNTIATFVVATGMHYGLWKPTAVSGSAGLIQTSVPGGLGHPTGRHHSG